MRQIIAKTPFPAGVIIPNDDRPTALELYEQAASLVPMAAFSCDLASERLTWTDGVFDIFGLSKQHVPERRAIVEIYSEESRELLERERSRAIQTCSGFSLDARLIRHDGQERWIRINAAVRSSHGHAKTLYGMKQDITEDRARWEALQAQAECDPLTGVANRARFQRFLDQPREASGDSGRDRANLSGVGALILFDLDGFKQVNDWWGHAAGDACLVALGERLRHAFPQARLISRIGGDEFAVLLPADEPRATTENAVHSLIGDLLRPVPWKGDLLPFSASIGLAFAAEEKAMNPHDLFVAADRALYDAKKSTSTVLICT